MTPAQIATRLRAISTKIDNSQHPSRRLVATDLRQVIAALGGQSVLNQSAQVDIPTIGNATVVLTRVDFMDENSWSGVTGTITLPDGSSLTATTTGGKSVSPGGENVTGDAAAEQFFAQLFSATQWRAIDVFASAVSSLIPGDEFPKISQGTYAP